MERNNVRRPSSLGLKCRHYPWCNRIIDGCNCLVSWRGLLGATGNPTAGQSSGSPLSNFPMPSHSVYWLGGVYDVLLHISPSQANPCSFINLLYIG